MWITEILHQIVILFSIQGMKSIQPEILFNFSPHLRIQKSKLELVDFMRKVCPKFSNRRKVSELIAKMMKRNMEIAWYQLYCEISYKLTTFLIVYLLDYRFYSFF